MNGICPTHGEVRAKASNYGDVLVLHCPYCGLECEPVKVEPKEPVVPLADGLEPVEIDALLDAAEQGGGWYEFEDGTRRRGRPAALRYVMEGE